MADFNEYDPKSILVTWNGILVSGYADGTFVELERNEDGFSTSVGDCGDVTRVRMNNRSGTLKLTLKSEAGVNNLLYQSCLLYTSPSPRDATLSRMPSSA